MRAEVLGIGTEILLGQIADTNSAAISQALANLGIDVYHHAVVGDNMARMLQQLQESGERADLIVLSGGLGPTEDDLTKPAIATYLNRELDYDSDALAKIEAYYRQTGQEPTENNRRQAQYVRGGQILKNDNGYAVGMFIQQTDGPDVLSLPGPPYEMQWMLDHYAIPALQAAYFQDEYLMSTVMRFFGIGESYLVTKVADLIEQINPTVAPYAKRNEVTLRVTVKASDRAVGQQQLDQTVAEIKQRLSAYFYGYGDDNSLVMTVVPELIKRHLTITAAESLTAGMFQSTIGSVPGVSAIFPGGFVTYANHAKHELLGIAEDIIDRGVVSEETAIAMAKDAQHKMGTDFAVSFTGVAGPDDLEGHPAGTVFIGLAFKDEPVIVNEVHLAGDRAMIRERSVLTGLAMIWQQLQNK